MRKSLLRFIIAFAIAYGIRHLTGLFLNGGWLREPQLTPMQRVPITVIMPVAVAALTFMLINAYSPRRLFDPRVNRPVSQWAIALTAAFCAAILGAVKNFWIDDLPMKVLSSALIAGMLTLIFVIRLPRRRAGHCVQCGAPFDRAESRCPGCGAADSREPGPVVAS